MNSTVSKYLNDPKWEDIMVLYSGLFEDEKDRENFIIDVNKTDFSLATNCELSGLNQNQKVTNEIEKKAFDNLENFNVSECFEIGCSSINTLLSLNIEFDIISLYNDPQGFQVKFLKNKIHDLFKQIKFQKIEALVEILKSNQKYFLIDLFQVLSESNFLNLNEQVFFLNNIDLKSIKVSQFEYLIKIFSKEVIGKSNFKINDLNYICVKSNNLNFINGIINYTDNKLKLKEVIDLKFQNIEKIRDCYFLFDFLKENKLFFKAYGQKIINELLKSNKDINKIFSYLLIKIGYDNSDIYLEEKKSKIYKKINLLNFFLDDIFFKSFQKLLEEDKRDIFLLDASKYVGKIMKSKISNLHKHHYYIHDKLEVFIPFNEAVVPLKINDFVNYIIVYYDKKNNIFIGSTKQLNSKPGKLIFDFDYLNIIKIGDIYNCKIVKINERFSIKIFGIKKNTKINILNPNFQYVEYENMYKAKIVSIKNLNNISVEILKNIVS